MSKKRQLVFAVLILVAGLAFINTYMFALPQDNCSCGNLEQAIVHCDVLCGPSFCMLVSENNGYCQGNTCAMYYKIYCEDGYRAGFYTFTECWDCGAH